MRGGWSPFVQVLVLSIALQIATFAAPFQLQLVVDEAIAQSDGDLLLVIALAFGGLVIVQALIEALRGWALCVFGHLLSFQVTGNLVRHLLRLPSDYFEKRHVGDIISRLQSVKPIQTAITQGVIGTLIDGIMAFIAAFILFFYSVTLAFIVIFFVLLNMAIALAMLPRMRQRMEEEILAEAREQTHLMETVRAATTLKLMGRESEREGIWRNLHTEATNISISVGKFDLSRKFIQNVTTGLQTVIVIYVAARLVLDGKGFSVGMLFAFLSFRQTFTDRAVGLVNQIIEFRFLRLHLDRLC